MGDIETGGTNYSFNYDGIFGQNVVLSARAAQHNEQSIQTGAGATVVGYIDHTNPLGDGTTVYGWSANSNANARVAGFGFFQNQEFSRDQYNVDLSWFVGNLAGSHEFKVGYEYEDIGVKNDNWNGGAGQRIYRFNCVQSATRDCQGNAYYFRHRIYLNSAGLDPTELTPADIQAPLTVDTKADQRRLLHSGHLAGDQQPVARPRRAFRARSSSTTATAKSRPTSTTTSNRVSALCGTPRATARSKVFGHWGKFYETIPMDIVIRSFGGEISIFSYNLSDDPNDVANDPTVRASRILGGGFSRRRPRHQGPVPRGVRARCRVRVRLRLGGRRQVHQPSTSTGSSRTRLSADGNYYIGNPGDGLMTGTYDLGYAYGYNDCPTPEDARTSTRSRSRPASSRASS